MIGFLRSINSSDECSVKVTTLSSIGEGFFCAGAEVFEQIKEWKLRCERRQWSGEARRTTRQTSLLTHTGLHSSAPQ